MRKQRGDSFMILRKGLVVELSEVSSSLLSMISCLRLEQQRKLVVPQRLFLLFPRPSMNLSSEKLRAFCSTGAFLLYSSSILSISLLFSSKSLSSCLSAWVKLMELFSRVSREISCSMQSSMYFTSRSLSFRSYLFWLSMRWESSFLFVKGWRRSSMTSFWRSRWLEAKAMARLMGRMSVELCLREWSSWQVWQRGRKQQLSARQTNRISSQ